MIPRINAEYNIWRIVGWTVQPRGVANRSKFDKHDKLQVNGRARYKRQMSRTGAALARPAETLLQGG